MEYPFKPYCDRWCALIKEAKKVKQERFGQYADECRRFYDGAHNFMWETKYARGPQGYLDDKSDIPIPTFQMTVNRVFEAVALFGPSLLHQYPQVEVTPTELPDIPPDVLGIDVNDPMLAQQYQMIAMQHKQESNVRNTIAQTMQFYLNWLQVEAGKMTHARRAVTDAVVSGLGLLLTEPYTTRDGSMSYPRSRFISSSQYIKDPDARYDEDVEWIAIEWTHAVNKVEQKFGLFPGQLKGKKQSRAMQAQKGALGEARGGKTESWSYDLITYWEIYSKNGFGDKLKAGGKNKSSLDLSAFGPFCRIVVADGVPYPLNLPPMALTEEMDDIFDRVQWQIPFFKDEGSGNGWPVSELFFYDKTDSVWPIPLFKPAIGELRFVNWCMSFLADKVAATSHEYIGVMKVAAEEIREQLANQKGPVKMIELSDMMGKSIRDIISILDKPSFDIGLWNMVAEVLQQIDRRTGVTDLLSGIQGRSMRSATEADARQDNLSIRPDDMAQKTEDWYSQAAMKEAETLVWLYDVEDVAPVLGPIGAAVFDQHILSQDPEQVVRDYKYRIAAGSARKPNKSAKQKSLGEFGQWAGDMLKQLALAGQVGPWNAFMRDFADSIGLHNVDEYLLSPPEPSDQPSPEEQEMELEQMKVQMEQMIEQVKLQMDQQKHAQEMLQDQEQHEQDMEQSREKHEADIAALKARTALTAGLRRNPQ